MLATNSSWDFPYDLTAEKKMNHHQLPHLIRTQQHNLDGSGGF